MSLDGAVDTHAHVVDRTGFPYPEGPAYKIATWGAASKMNAR